jgi:hypothetical protein
MATLAIITNNKSIIRLNQCNPTEAIKMDMEGKITLQETTKDPSMDNMELLKEDLP